MQCFGKHVFVGLVMAWSMVVLCANVRLRETSLQHALELPRKVEARYGPQGSMSRSTE
jgi:hypothetical protein